MDTYKVIKFNRDGDNEIIFEGLTEQEAKEQCQGDDSHGEGWFFGFTKE
jgi:hypothetical protein